LGDWTTPPKRDGVLGDIRPLAKRSGDAVEEIIGPWITRVLASRETALQQEIMAAASKLEIAVGNATWITDSRRDIEVRRQLLTMMAERNDDQLPQAIDAAIESNEPLLRVHAAQRLADLDPTRAVAVLRRIIVDGSIAEKQIAFTTLEKIPLPEVDSLLAEWLVKLQAGDVPPPLKYEIMSTANTRNSPIVQQQLSSLLSYLGQQPSIAARYQAVLEGGSIQRGRMLLENRTGIQCLRCHTVNGKGGKVGPDLSKICGIWSSTWRA
jgi:quinoprotein glucose dehydrogenase